MRLLLQILLVALGSAAGGLACWGVYNLAGRLFGTAFPVGTFVVNISGCFFLGWFIAWITLRLPVANYLGLHADDLRLLAAVGFTGAYTTFSSYEWEANGLLSNGHAWLGTFYLIGSVVLGLLAVRLGVVVAELG